MKKKLHTLLLCCILAVTALFSCKKNNLNDEFVENSKIATIAAAQTASATSNGKVSLGYHSFSQWYSYNWNHIQYEDLTHIVMSFITTTSSSNATLTYNGNETEDFKNYPLTNKTFFGYATQLIPKAHTNGVKVLMGIAGYDKLTGIFASSSLRAAFINNILSACQTYGFDGVDLDYEYPTSRTQGANMEAFVSELHNAVQANTTINKPFEITMAVAYGNFASQYINFSNLLPYCDFFNVMTYDYEAPWSTYFGHNAPLYADAAAGSIPASKNTHNSMEYYKNQKGIPANKLVVGLPFYGYKYDNYSYLYGLKSNSNGTGLAYFQIYNEYINQPGWVYNWSSSAKVPYLVNSSTSQMLSFDDSASIATKCDYTNANNYRGVMVWELSRGYIPTLSPSQPLLKVMGNKIVRYTPPPAEALQSGATYKITTAMNGTSALDVNGAGVTDGTKTIIWNYGGGNNQKWRVTKLANGNYKLNPLHALTKALNVNGSSSADGATVNIWTDNGSTAQQWILTSTGANQYTMSPVCAPGKMMDVYGANTANGTNVITWSANSATNQKWIFTKL